MKTTKLSKINSWLRVIADLGILIGIVLVLVQLRQNENLMRSQILNQYHDSYSSYEASFAGENLPSIWEKSLLNPEKLSLGEMRVLEAVTFSPLFRWINLHRQNEAGLLGELDWRNEIRMDAKWYFGSTYGRAWWNTIAKEMHRTGYLPDEIFQLVETSINDPEIPGPTDHYEDIQKLIRAEKEKE